MAINTTKIILSEEQYYDLILENNKNKIIAYHSSPSKITSFSLNFLGNGNDEYGPGIYFTNDKESIFDYGNYGYEVELNINKLLPTNKKATYNQIKKLIQNSPEFEEVYENFIERWYDNERLNKNSAFNNMIRLFSNNKNAFKQFEAIWADLYKDHPKDWCENISNFFGYDGVIRRDFEGKGILHYIMYNPAKIKILKIFENK